jgi:hypothetical protein
LFQRAGHAGDEGAGLPPLLRRHAVALTETGAKRLAEAECALAAVENEVLGALDDSQREVLYNLLLQAARGSDVSCPFD